MEKHDPALDGDSTSSGRDDGVTVLDLFGVKLKVNNPRIAEVLTMDAGEALGTDVRRLLDPDEMRQVRGSVAQGLPEVAIAPPSAKDSAEADLRAQMRARSDAIATAIGFDIAPAGMWESPTGISILTRVIERPLSYAGASDYVDKIAVVLKQQKVGDSTALLIVCDQQAADVFKVAIRQRRLYNTVRTISAENLESVRSLYGSGSIDHSRVLVLLTPIANADAGELLSIIRSDGLEGAVPGVDH